MLGSQIPENFEELLVSSSLSLSLFLPKSSVSLQTKQIKSVGHREGESKYGTHRTVIIELYFRQQQLNL